MKAELEAQDIEKIADMVAERLKLALRNDTGKNNSDDTLFDVHGLAEYLKVSEKWVYKRTAAKKIPHKKIDGLLLFRKREIDRWIETHNSRA